ncbi:progranulin-like [Mixophyes fleayi]|uniref:progranulin-like n=1 Tax=Mixophyes fleayi TaxID=3061075 RepID=UPI003F4D8AB2
MAPPWHLLLLVASVGAARCPDGTTCSEKTLCCELPGGNGYGCCPEGEVVSRSLPMITSEISCTDRTGCPEEYSCVSTPQGGSACCPIAQGTSCQDGHHCCHSGSHCSEDGHYCIPAANLSAVLCPDGRSECPSDTSCCQMADQSWGCCPLPQATCCDDHLHCCPLNAVCDLENGRCLFENGHVPLSKKFPARMKLLPSTVKCEDATVCPGTSTCCRLTSGEWGCCPFEKVSKHKVLTVPWYKKMAALKYDGGNLKCGDSSFCPDKTTCCQLPSGDWGCCPIEQAVCCSDHLHCCPSGYTCDGSSGTCSKPPEDTIESASTLQPLGVVWCDSSHYCSDGQTCCVGHGGLWICCPYTQGVCCPDRVHCCPYGHVCLNSGTYCSRSGNLRWDLGYGEIPLLR